MQILVVLLQWCVVLAVPAIFGGLVLRRVTREADWRIVAGGGLILGQAALMLVANALRFVLEMDAALWLTFQVLVAGSVVLVALTPPLRIRRYGSYASRGGPAALTLAGAILAAVYFGIPAFRGLLHDAWWFHYPTAVRIQAVAHFPLSPPFAPDDLLYYHYGPDLQAALLSQALRLPISQGFAGIIVLHVAGGFLLTIGLVHRLTRSLWTGLVGATLLYLGGNLRFLLLAFTDWSNPWSALKVFNSQTVDGLLKLTFTPSHAIGIPLTLVTLAVYRRFLLRPTWDAAIVLGFLAGAISLVAEWYYVPLVIVLGGQAATRLWRTRRSVRERRIACRLAGALTLAAGTCFFNGSYLAGLFAHYWQPQPSIHEVSTARIWSRAAAFFPADEPILTRISAPRVIPPPLLPLRLNLSRLGTVPSWENAQATGGTYIALWSPRFLLEALPILLPGVVIAGWILRRHRHPVLRAIALLALISCLPPIMLDWGYRSTDFLRFFTAAVAFSALLVAWWLVPRLRDGPWPRRAAAGACLGTALVNCVGLGLIGLMPGVFTQAKALSDQGASLGATAAPQPGPAERDKALARLAEKARLVMRPSAGGRENLVVAMPRGHLPPCEEFPEFLKLTTLTTASIPIGWFWTESIYTRYYEKAATELDPLALVALDVRWVIVTNLFGASPPPEVETRLRQPGNFTYVARFTHADYYLELYRVAEMQSPSR